MSVHGFQGAVEIKSTKQKTKSFWTKFLVLIQFCEIFDLFSFKQGKYLLSAAAKKKCYAKYQNMMTRDNRGRKKEDK